LGWGKDHELGDHSRLPLSLQALKSGSKRAAPKDKAPAAKKAKGAAASGDGEGFDVKTLEGSTEDTVITPSSALPYPLHLQLMANTAVALKEICRDLGLPVSGTKAVLVQRILQALS
jgi:hypothetical protein